ncbi:amphi-Trp domain-containing protein [Halobacterium bonnevillei]|uniref:Amphi-Trp domain-containing protein n=1 Tax=Halobacterium bonnevillei TaxID=2692200 RepID=A0A6B0SPY9_9EURY|nr:amphi-Trp domain-containing protein [Halobacterium bonnevillei]MXR21593.1 amphi-Trp domain-containing protein [Halobacterium bonnevillei]
MAERTSNVESLDREAAADRLEDVASALREGDLDIHVGNKTIQLHPPTSVDYQIAVVERNPRFRGRRETVKIKLDWKPD